MILLFRTRQKLWALALCIASVSLWGGEPLEFSSTNKSVNVPKRNPLQRFLERPFESLKPETSLGPVILPHVPGSLEQPNQADRDELFRKRLENNWIFAAPERLDREKAIRDALGVREPKAQGSSAGKAPNYMEEYFRLRNQTSGQKANTKAERGENRSEGETGYNPDNQQNRDRTTSDSLEDRSDSLFDRDSRKERNGVDRRNATGRPENGELNLSEYLKGMQADAKKERDRERRNREFQDILNAAPNAWSPGSPSLSSRMWETPAASSASVSGPGKEMDLFSRPVRREVAPPSSTPLNSHSISVLTDTSRRLQPNSATPLETPVNEASKQRERPMVMSIPKLQR